MSWLKQLFCFHDWQLVKHQIGTRMAIWTLHCEKCHILEDHVAKVAPWCEARKPTDLFGNPH